MLGGRKNESRELHPLVKAEGLSNVLDRLPACAGVLDAHGGVVYRNKVAGELLAGLIAQHGDTVVQAFRVAFADATKRVRTFPHVEILDIPSDRGVIKVELSLAKLTEAYLVSWRDVTAEQERIRAISETARDLAAASYSFDELSGRLAADAESVASRADSVSAGAHQLSASIQSISMSTSAAANDTATAVEAAGGANDRISQLIESSTQVEAVSKLINSIAEQTNLLALNATIEAARAGEAGKGFAVVAGEVKDLAGRTSEATDRIGTTIQAIQSDSATVASSIARIVELIGEIEAKQTMIASAVEEQSATATEMSTTVTAVAGSAQSTAQVITELRAVAATILSESQRLHDLV